MSFGHHQLEEAKDSSHYHGAEGHVIQLPRNARFCDLQLQRGRCKIILAAMVLIDVVGSRHGVGAVRRDESRLGSSLSGGNERVNPPPGDGGPRPSVLIAPTVVVRIDLQG